MPTLAEFRQRMIQIDPKSIGADGGIGRTFAILSVGSKHVNVTALRMGGIDGSSYTNRFMVRPLAASVDDRIRYTVDFDSVNGRISHDGADYSGTLTTGEMVELTEPEPAILDDCIQQALGTTRYRDVTTIPMRGDGRYYLDELDWIDSAANVRVGWVSTRTLSRNRGFEKWNGYQSDTAGALAPDFWTLGEETGATYARTAVARRGDWALQMTATGSGASVSQTVDLGWDGVSADTLRGQQVTIVAVAKTGTASSFRARFSDGVTTTFTDFHTGSGLFEELTATHTISTTALGTGTLSGLVAATDTVELDELYLVFGAVDDGVRRDVLPSTYNTSPARFEQVPLLLHSKRGRGASLVIVSERPYAKFDEDRVLAGTADSDESDAPLDLIAYGALYRFYETQPNTPANQERFFRFRKAYFERRAMNYPARPQRYGALDTMMPHAMGPIARIG